MSLRSIGILAMLTAIAAGAAGEELRLTQGPATNPLRRGESTQRNTSVTIVSPSEGEQVALPLRVTVQGPSGARDYSLECAYWDQSRGAWVHPGLLGSGFSGGQTATIDISADMLKKVSSGASRWRLRARATDPPGPWGGWREFMLQPIQSENAVSQAGASHMAGLDLKSPLHGFTTQQQTLFEKVSAAAKATDPSSLGQNWRGFLDGVRDTALTENSLRALALIALSDPLRGVIADLDKRVEELERGISSQLLFQEKLSEVLSKIDDADRTKGSVMARLIQISGPSGGRTIVELPPRAVNANELRQFAERIRELAAEADYEISRAGRRLKADAQEKTKQLRGFLDQLEQLENDVKKHIAERARRLSTVPVR